jgi:16S rRNA (uracil1498-N3)-methyltransferase
MRSIRIYEPGDYQPGETILLASQSSHHIGVVLRMRPGDPLTLFPGDNYEYSAIIDEASNKKKIQAHIISRREANRESPLKIHLAQVVSKGDRMETVIQKAAELGVQVITPLISQHSVIKLDQERWSKKLAQWQAVAISACEQCGRNKVPIINSVISLEDFIQTCHSPHKFILNPEAKNKWSSLVLHEEVSLLIGPEGGMSKEEIQAAKMHGFLSTSLGPRILRTETAAIVALSILQANSGDL